MKLLRKLFSNEENKIKRVNLKDVSSHRGMGRASLGNLRGLVGGYAGKKAADRADMMGLTDEEILAAARRRGLTVGAGMGVITSVGKSPKRIVKRAAVGGLFGRWGSGKNTRVRLNKRAKKEKGSTTVSKRSSYDIGEIIDDFKSNKKNRKE